MVNGLADLGATPVAFPTIVVDDPSDGGVGLRRAAAQIESYEWVVLTSANGVGPLVDAVGDPDRLASSSIAVIGPATASALFDRTGRVPDLTPPRFVAESLLDAFPDAADSGRLVLVARAEVARPVLPDGLARKGWDVDLVASYRVRAVEPDADRIDDVDGSDVVTFTSPSTFERFLELAGAERLPPVIACIGPITAEAVRSAGWEVAIESSVHTTEGLLASIVDWAEKH